MELVSPEPMYMLPHAYRACPSAAKMLYFMETWRHPFMDNLGNYGPK